MNDKDKILEEIRRVEGQTHLEKTEIVQAIVVDSVPESKYSTSDAIERMNKHHKGLSKEPQECEWSRQGAEDFVITNCGHRPYKITIDNCGFKIDYCPYCGRKVAAMK